MSYDENMMYCQVCRESLMRVTTEGVVSYIHALKLRREPADHNPKVVPLSALNGDPVMECDVCSAPDPIWIYVCDDQLDETKRVTAEVRNTREYQERYLAARVRRVDTEGKFTKGYGKRWTACDRCADAIERRAILDLVYWATQGLPSRFTRPKRLADTRAHIRRTFEHLLDTLHPGRGHILPGRPEGVWEEVVTP